MIIMAEFKRIARFYKVSKEQYLKSFEKSTPAGEAVQAKRFTQ